MNRKIYQIQTQPTPSTPGASQDFLPYVVRKRDSTEVLTGMLTGAQPLPIVSAAQTEGTDFPFYTRSHIGQYVRPKRRAYSGFAQFPTPIFEANQDNSLLFFQSVMATPVNWRQHQYKKRIAAYQGIWVSPPQFYFERPFTDYQDNLCRLLSEIQRHLLEPTIDDGYTWTFHTRDEVVGAVNQRIAKFLVETGLIRKRATIALLAGQVEYDLPTDVIEIRRVDLDGAALNRLDELQLDVGRPGWQLETGTPFAYIEEPRPSLTIKVVPIPTVGGTVTINYVPLPEAVTACNPLPIPATFVPYIKWGALADLLAKEGEANDPQRAAYCEERFSEGIELARALLGTEN